MKPNKSRTMLTDKNYNYKEKNNLIRLKIPTIFILICYLFILSCYQMSGVTNQEIKIQNVNRSLMCPVCPGESIDQSQHPLAVQMRNVVETKINEGWTENQVRDFFEERYGTAVLLEPSKEGVHLVIWIIPIIIFIISFGALIFVIKSMLRKNQLLKKKT
ncbi:MAG: hypothetical protein CL770_04375 [Chloroflexi bacterium]|nr:hypothetical protein [Chloroflexota bacterium]|tara:strand:- start:16855 stop:17334 length:480 start_codon:yes stop_codon:yes gene_type:complete